jgi:hypothetical protein
LDAFRGLSLRKHDVRGLVCKMFGHRWAAHIDACDRCKTTGAEIHLRSFPQGDPEDPNDAYWRGVRDGRKLDRKRAYRLGYIRGGMSVWSLVEETFNFGSAERAS